VKLYNFYHLLRSRLKCGGNEKYANVVRDVTRSNHCRAQDILISSAKKGCLQCRRVQKVNNETVNRARHNDFSPVCNRPDEDLLLKCANIQIVK
jgi:hypothetical protein